MEKIVSETNSKLNSIISALNNVKKEYEKKLEINQKNIDDQLAKVKKFKIEYEATKEKIEQSKKDIRCFEEDYQSLVKRFKDDELSSILVAANKEITAKVEERKKRIIKDKTIMNTLLAKANKVKSNLVILTTEKKSLEIQYKNISDAYEFYNTSLTEIIEFANNNNDNLLSYFKKDFDFNDTILENTVTVEDESENYDEDLFEDFDDDDIEDIEEETLEKQEDIEDIDFSLDDIDLSDIDLNDIILDDDDDENSDDINFDDIDLDDDDLDEIDIDDNNDLELEEENIDNNTLDFDDIIINDDNNIDEDEIYFDDILVDSFENEEEQKNNYINLDDIDIEDESDTIDLDQIINIDDIEDDDDLFN